MSVRKFSTASILSPAYKNSKIWDGETFPGYFESIATVIVDASGANSITFSNIPQNYTHLQVRTASRTNRSAWGDTLQVRINGDTGSNYYGHYVFGDGANPSAGSYGATTGLLYCGVTSAASAPSSTMAVNIIDILDYTSTSKNKVIRVLEGNENNSTNGFIGFVSGSWNNSSTPINTLVFSVDSGLNFQQFSQFSLYGIRGA